MTAPVAAPPAKARMTSPSFWDQFARRAQECPDAPLVVDGLSGARLSWAATRDRACGLAAALVERGLAPGQVVTWQLPTGLPAFVLQLALARLGAVQNPLISLYGPTETQAVLERSRPRFYVIPRDEAHAAAARRLVARLAHPPQVITLGDELPSGDATTLPPPPADGGEVRWIYATSGTTAEPKGVRHADDALLRAGRDLALAMQAGPRDVGTIAYPIAHIGGAMYTAMLMASGASAVLLPRFQVAEAVDVFARHGVTITGGSTAHYQAFVAEQRRRPGVRMIPTLRLLNGGGAPKPPDLVGQVRETLSSVLAHAYGMTESPLMATCRVTDTDEQLAHSEGAVCDSVDLRIVLAGGGEAARGEEGEIRVRGPGLFKGYTDPALDRQAFDAEGWFRTGDLGRLRADGHVAVTGRLKDVIIRKGENISSREIEELLARHPRVGDVAVIGLPDAERGERVCAVVEPRVAGEHLSFAEMRAWFEQAGVMRQKIPEQLEVLDRLPRMASLGKVSKAELRARFGGL